MSLPASDDYFAIFTLEPRPWVDVEALRESFARLSADLHPDKHQGKPVDELAAIDKRYATVNRAFQVLREPKERLLYLYELASGKKPTEVQRIPPGTMDLFVEVGQLCQKLDAHSKDKAGAATALDRAGVMVAGLDLQESLSAMQTKLQEYSQWLDSELQQLDKQWVGGEKKFDSLETLYRKFSYVWRWQQQLEERQVALLTD
jgi:curved DNA-binding protein CbpA